MDLHLQLDRSEGNLAAQIAAELRDAVRSGRLLTDCRLPPTRDLSRDLGVSRGVVVEAYEQLVGEGFLVSRQGSGTRVAHLIDLRTPTEPAASRQPCGAGATDPAPQTFDLLPGIPNLAAFPRRQWLAAIRNAVTRMPSSTLGYPAPEGLAELRHELTGYLRRVRAAACAPEDLVVVGGVTHGLHLTLGALAGSGIRVLAVEDPCNQRIPGLLAAAGVTAVPVPVDDEGIDVAALRSTEARAVLVSPAHQYPTGAVLSAQRRAALVEWAAQVDGIVIEEEYDAEFRYDREPVGCLQGLAPDHVVLLGSVSRTMAPGLRLGWCVAPQWLTAQICRGRLACDLGTPVIDQAALANLIATGEYGRHLRNMRRRYRARRDATAMAIAAELPSAVVRGVSAGMHLLMQLPRGCREAEIVSRAARRGVSVAGLSQMLVRVSAPPSLVLGYAKLTEDQLTTAVGLLAEVIEKRR